MTSKTTNDLIHSEELIRRHEREFGELTQVTKTLADQNKQIVESLGLFNETITDLKVIISKQEEHLESVLALKTEQEATKDLVHDIKRKMDLHIEISKAESDELKKNVSQLLEDTSHIKMFNKPLKTIQEKSLLGVLLFILLATGLVVVKNYKLVATLFGINL